MKTVTVQIKLQESGLPHFYCKSLRNCSVLAIHLIKSGEWIYPIYRVDLNERLSGYVYEGTKLTLAQITTVLSQFAPPTLYDLKEYASKYATRVKYFKVKQDQMQIIGTYDNRNILKPHK